MYEVEITQSRSGSRSPEDDRWLSGRSLRGGGGSERNSLVFLGFKISRRGGRNEAPEDHAVSSGLEQGLLAGRGRRIVSLELGKPPRNKGSRA